MNGYGKLVLSDIGNDGPGQKLAKGKIVGLLGSPAGKNFGSGGQAEKPGSQVTSANIL